MTIADCLAVAQRHLDHLTTHTIVDGVEKAAVDELNVVVFVENASFSPTCTAMYWLSSWRA